MNKHKYELAGALRDSFISPNCLDANLETTNIVDALYYLAVAAYRLATAIGVTSTGKKWETTVDEPPQHQPED
jgi:hypothetical protein